MTSEVLDRVVLALRALCSVGAALCAVIAAFLALLSKAQDKRERAATKEWFRRHWIAVEGSRWLVLPELLVAEIVTWKHKFQQRTVTVFFGGVTPAAQSGAWLLLPACGGLAGTIQSGWLYGVWLAILMLPACLVPLSQRVPKFGSLLGRIRFVARLWLLCLTLLLLWSMSKMGVELEFILIVLFVLLPALAVARKEEEATGCVTSLTFVAVLLVMVSCVSIAARLSPVPAMLLMIIALPAFGIGIVVIGFWGAQLSRYFRKVLQVLGVFDPQRQLLMIAPLLMSGLYVGLSIVMTLLALGLGHLVQPSELLPQSIQMFSYNVLFDSLTIAFAFWSLEITTEYSSIVAIPLVITGNVLFGALCACCSLLFGLWYTPLAMTPVEVVLCLVGRSRDNSTWDLGPTFWTMHTAFLPLLAAVGLVLSTWIAKAFLSSVRWLFGHGQHKANPMELASAYFGFLMAIFIFLQFILKVIAGSSDVVS